MDWHDTLMGSVLVISAGGAAADDQQRAGQAAVLQAGQEVAPGGSGLPGAGARPMKAGLPSALMPQAARTGSAGEPGRTRNKPASTNR
jgi:hypothetical protein